MQELMIAPGMVIDKASLSIRGIASNVSPEGAGIANPCAPIAPTPKIAVATKEIRNTYEKVGPLASSRIYFSGVAG